MKSRGSQCNETLVRTAVRPGEKLGLQSAANDVTAVPVLTPADCSESEYAV